MSYWRSGHKLQDGRYVVEKVLGTGGSGITYLARDLTAKHYVAIKTLNAAMQINDDFEQQQAKFVQEAFRLAKFRHQHIVNVQDVCQEGSLWCMVMEFIDGGTLSNYALAQKGLSEEEALYFIQQVGEALNYLHCHNLLHRDVKPGNIMLRPDNQEAVLIDFGLARDFHEGEVQTHTNARTESFAPIEQYIKRTQRGAYTDVYALAATLYYVLTLKLPFPAPIRQQGAQLIEPKQHNGQISDRTNQAILLGMAIEPKERVQSVPEWLEILKKSGGSQLKLPQSRLLDRNTSRQIPSQRPMGSRTVSNNLGPNSPQPGLKSSTATLRDKTTLKSVKQARASGSLSTKPKGYAEQPLTALQKKTYYRLHALLTKKQWQGADGETDRLILQLSGREAEGWLDAASVTQIPGHDLYIINQLWMKCSEKHFGFSAQKRIYEALGGQFEYDQMVWELFGEQVGWFVNNEWLSYENYQFELSAPAGHLPSLWGRIRGGALLLRDEFPTSW